MKKNRIIALLTVIVFGTCIVGCGNEVAPDSNSTNEVEANIEETNSDVPIVTPDVIFGDSFQDYVGERITVVGYPGFYTKFDDSTKDSLKEMGDGYLFITTKSELDWTAPQVFCIFDGDQTDVFTDEILDSFRENGTLIGITGICKERALLADCNPEFKQFDKTEVPFYQTDESSDTETSSITTKTDSTQDPENTKTISKAQETYTYAEFMSELETLLKTPEYSIYDEKCYSDPLDGFNLMPHNEQKDILENGETMMRSIYFQSNRNPDMAIILGVKIENNKITQIIVASAVYIKSPTLANELRELVMDGMMIPCGILEQCKNRNEVHELYEELANSEKVNSSKTSFTYELNKDSWSATMEVNSVDGTWIIINPQPDKREQVAKKEASKSKSETSKTESETTKAIPVDTITSAYNNNEVSANNDYLNKFFTIKGTVYKVEKVNNPSYASDLEPGEYHVYLMGSSPVDWVNCYFDSDLWISNLNRGDEIMISGTCIGIPSFALHPCMKGCSRSY